MDLCRNGQFSISVYSISFNSHSTLDVLELLMALLKCIKLNLFHGCMDLVFECQNFGPN